MFEIKKFCSDTITFTYKFNHFLNIILCGSQYLRKIVKHETLREYSHIITFSFNLCN